jgi:hypothetical protein
MFVGAFQILDGALPLARGTSVVPAFKIDEFLRLAAPEILGAAPGCMLPHPPLYIGGNPGIERVVRAKNDIDMPVQS